MLHRVKVRFRPAAELPGTGGVAAATTRLLPSRRDGAESRHLGPIADIDISGHTGAVSRLILRYEYDPSFSDPELTRDDFGRLWVSVQTDRFCGRGGFWVQWQDLKEFGDALGSYPIEDHAPLVAQWGYDLQQGDDLILRIEIAAANGRGDLVVRFEIADEHEPRERIRGSFMTNYPDLEVFRSSIDKLMNNEADEAVLNGR